MQRKTIYGLFVAVLLVAVSFGFYKIVNNDPTTAVSFSTYRSAIQTPATTGDSPLLGTWSVGAVVPIPTSYGGAGIGYSRNDTCWLYAVNGDTNGSSGSTGAFRKYNLNTNTWTSLPPAQGRSWNSATKSGPVSNTNIFTLGGLPSGASAWTSLTGTLQKYNINTNTWSSLLDAPIPVGSPGLSSYQDSLIYAVGGMGTGGLPIANVQLYNATSNTWRTATPLPAPRVNGWMVIRNDTIYYGCGASTGSTFENNIYVGKISSADRSLITWTVSAVTYPGVSRHRMDASDFAGGFFIGPGAGATWWGTGTDAYIWNGGNSAFVSVGPVPVATSDAYVGTASFQRGTYKVWKAVVAGGLILSAPYSINNNQIYTDSVLAPPTSLGLTNCRNSINKTIPDVSTVGIQDTILIAVTGTILDINVKIDTITHTFDADLDVTLFHGAIQDTLFHDAGSSGDNFFGTILNDSASTPIASGTAPFTGSYIPTNLLANMNGTPVNGMYILRCVDDLGGDVGILQAWCVTITYQTLSGVISTITVPNKYSLKQNYPNPFNPVTKINFALPKQGFVTLKVYDMIGREVRTLVNETKSAGNFTVDFNGSDLSSGIYFYKLESEGFSDVKKMMLIK